MIAPAGMPRQGALGSRSISRPRFGTTESPHDRKHHFLQPVLGNGWKTASRRKDPAASPSPAGRRSRYDLQQHLGLMPCPRCRGHCPLEKTTLSVVCGWQPKSCSCRLGGV